MNAFWAILTAGHGYPPELWHPTYTQHLKLLDSEICIQGSCAKLRFICKWSQILKLLENTENYIFHNKVIL